MAAHESNGRRRILALTEIEALAVNMIHDLRILHTSVECVLAEVREARKAS
jgi:hypothetical protein